MASASAKPTKNQLRRAKKKAQRNEVLQLTVNEIGGSIQQTNGAATPDPIADASTPKTESAPKSPVSKPKDVPKKESRNGALSPDPLIFDEDNSLFEMYKNVMGKFEETDDEDMTLKVPEKPEVYFDDDDDIPDEEEVVHKISKKKRKEQNKLSVAQLKALVRKPENVEWTDTSAPDPRLLVHIKSYRNVVPVPTHWSLKREYLSSKRGIEKPAFSLPKFIQATGIAEMRDAVLEKQDQASLKQRQRERVQPKDGKVRHRLSETLRSIFSASDQARADQVWRGLL